MNPDLLVSIVLPTYNGARFLPQSIESCLEQTWPHWELILVDDGSTDDTASIAERYRSRDARIRVVRHEVNRGLPTALNTGFRQARGEFLTWTSDDNRYLPEALSEMVAFLESHPQADLVAAGYRRIDDAGQPIEHVAAGPLDDLPLRNCVGGCFLYRRRVYEALGDYREDLFLAEDYDYWLRAAARFRLGWLAHELYEFRRHAGSLSASRHQRAELAIERALADNLPGLAWLSGERRARAWLGLMHVAMSRGDRAAARRYLLRAMAANAWRCLRDEARSAAWLLTPAPLYALCRSAGRRLVPRGQAGDSAAPGSGPPSEG